MTHFPGLGEVVVFYPENDNVTRLSHPMVWEFTKYCLSVKPKDGFADAQHFEPAKLRQWQDFLIVLDQVPETNDFQYRSYGQGIAKVSGFDMTGRHVSDFDSEVGRFFLRQYRECIADRTLIHSEHYRVHSVTNCEWQRVLCPVQDGNKVSIALVNIPIPRTC